MFAFDKPALFTIGIEDQKEGDRINCAKCFSDIITVEIITIELKIADFLNAFYVPGTVLCASR